MQYTTEVKVKELSKDQLLGQYRMEHPSGEACRLCPDYGRVWSCPPGIPDPQSYLEPYGRVCLVAVKVCYPESERQNIHTLDQAMEARAVSYELVKKKLLLALLEKEGETPGAKVLGAGRCILCEQCTRELGKPCRFPEKRRYSITGFGLNFSKLLEKIFGLQLLWSSDGLPEYDVAVAALFLPGKEAEGTR